MFTLRASEVFENQIFFRSAADLGRENAGARGGEDRSMKTVLRGRLKAQVVFAGERLRGQNIISSSRRNWFRLDSEVGILPLEYISPTRSDFLDALLEVGTVALNRPVSSVRHSCVADG